MSWSGGTMNRKIGGVITALVTPFHGNKVDYASLESLVEHQLENGVNGFVVNGTTGESPTLSLGEVQGIYEKVRAISGKNFPILLGTGSNSTDGTIRMTQLAADWGADAALVVVPYYNKPPQEGLLRHFQEISEKAELPVMLYNVPGRTVVGLSQEVVETLSRTKNIVGLKEASGDIPFGKRLREVCDPSFILLSGDDASAIELSSVGGDGVISVISHLIPKEMRALIEASKGRQESSQKDYKVYDGLNRLLGAESNPIPVKMALYQMGLIASPELRLPLRSLDEAFVGPLRAELEAVGISCG